MKYNERHFLTSILLLFWVFVTVSCNDQPATTATPPFVAYGKVSQSTDKPVRDTIYTSDKKIATVVDHYAKSVTVSYDSAVFVTSYNVTTGPVDTVVPPPTTGYALTYQNAFSDPKDIDPQDHGQKGNGYIDNGWFRSRPADVSAGVRSEVQLDNDMLPLEGAVEYDVQYLYVVQNQCHSFQIHGSTSGSSSILALWHIDGKFVVRTNSGGNNVSQSQPTTKIIVGQVYKMRVEYKIGTSGYYRWFINGSAYANANTTIKNGSSQWVKLGFNGAFDKNKTEAMRSDIKYDNWKIYRKS